MLSINIPPDILIDQFMDNISDGDEFTIPRNEHSRFIDASYNGKSVEQFDHMIINHIGTYSSSVTFVNATSKVKNPVFMNRDIYRILNNWG